MDEIKTPVHKEHVAGQVFKIVAADGKTVNGLHSEAKADQIVAALNAQQPDCPPSGDECKPCYGLSCPHWAMCHPQFKADVQQLDKEALQAAARIVELEKEREEYLKDLLLCPCGWIGDVDDQDSGNTERGCCPHCGNENLVFASKAINRIVELEKACRWIPVSEGPPETDGQVWICYKITGYTYQAYYDVVYKKWSIFDPCGGFSDIDFNSPPTHWKPIVLPADLSEEVEDGKL